MLGFSGRVLRRVVREVGLEMDVSVERRKPVELVVVA